MNEELQVMENNEINEVEEIDVVELDSTEDGGSLGTVIKVGVGLLALAAGAAVGVKKLGPKVKAWKTEKDIKKLNKKGYVVYKAEDVEIHEVETDDVEDSDEE